MLGPDTVAELSADLPAAPADFRDTELNPLPVDWQLVRLGEVLAHRKEFITVRDEDEYKRCRVQVRAQGIVLRDFVRGADLTIKQQQIVRAGDFLVAEIDAKVGGFGIVPPTLDGAVVSSHYFRFEIDRKRLFEDFLGFAAMTPSFQKQVSPRGSTNYASVRPKHVMGYLIPLPPLSEQRAIARVLRTVQRAREAAERVVAATRQLKQAMLRHLFTYGPVPVDQADRVPLKETEIGPVPEHWEVLPLGNVLRQTQYGLSVRGQRSGQFPMLRMNNLTAGRLDTTDLQFVDLDPATFARYRLNRGDLLFNRTNSLELVGKTAMFDEDDPFTFASYLVRVVVDPNSVVPAYLSFYMNDQRTQARLKLLASRGVSQSNINATKLRGLVVPVPPLAEQSEIVRVLDTIDNKFATAERRCQSLLLLFQSLLHNLMTGQVRVHGLTELESIGGA